MITAIIRLEDGSTRKAILDKTYNLLVVSCVACACLSTEVTLVGAKPQKAKLGDWEVVDIQHSPAKDTPKPAKKKKKRTALV